METINFLRNQPLTEGLSEEELVLLSHIVDEKVYQPDAIIIEENELTTDIYFIVEGEVRLLKWDEMNNLWRLIEVLKKGDIFGEMAFLDSSPRSTRVTAHGLIKLLKLSKDKLDIISIYNKIIKNIAWIGIHRLRLTTQKYVNDRQQIL